MYRVLIAEDEDIIRKGLVYSVDWEAVDACVVGEAGNGVEGIELIEKLKPDIVITDINMPVVDGLKMICETYERVNYAAIILSGYSDFKYAQEAIHYGVVEYLLKPLKSGDLQAAVGRAKDQLRRMQGEEILHDDRQREILEQTSLLSEDTPKEGENPVVEDMLAYVAEHYNEKILMRDVVKALSYSESFLNAKFKLRMGSTFNEYLNRYRIQKAVELMQTKKMSMRDIAMACGFSDYKYFTSVFKKYVGYSPKEFTSNI